MRSAEIFAGAGGLALGVSNAGFRHEVVAEWDRDACNTIRHNQSKGVKTVEDWPLFEGDVRNFDWSSIREGLDLLAGGPPCQPFSLGGKHRGHRDGRDMFPVATDLVRKLQPRAFIFENVKGLLRQSFAKYFEYIYLQLNYPEIRRRNEESWHEHLVRLERYHTKGRKDGLSYQVVFSLLNAADYGVPQKRERVFIVGFRSDQNIEWSFPKVTHSQDALLWDQWITGEYWDRHEVSKRRRPEISDKVLARVSRLRLAPPVDKAWLTVRDAISDLPDPGASPSHNISNHKFNPGARAYPGHTGSPLDEPAKTLKAGDHGVPGGENMLVLSNGRIRYFTVRESARLQSFPDDYFISGSWTESMRQLGNAVPVRLAQKIAGSVADKLRGKR